jgi:hypothetical protein
VGCSEQEVRALEVDKLKKQGRSRLRNPELICFKTTLVSLLLNVNDYMALDMYT